MTPSGGAVYSSNGHLNTAAWSSFLSSTNLGNLSPLTSAQLSYPEVRGGARPAPPAAGLDAPHRAGSNRAQRARSGFM